MKSLTCILAMMILGVYVSQSLANDLSKLPHQVQPTLSIQTTLQENVLKKFQQMISLLTR